MKQTLNFVWIGGNISYYDPTRSCCGSLIPADLLNNAFLFAHKNPEVETFIWFDSACYERHEIQFFNNRCAPPPSVRFRDLRTIPSYDENDRMNHPRCQDVWKKVDLARLTVLNHVLSVSDTTQAFYSDFDIRSFCLNAARIQDPLKKNGFLFNLNGSGNGGAAIENQFMGFSKQTQKLLERDILSTVRQCLEQGAPNGWLPFAVCAQRVFGLKKALQDGSVLTYSLWGNYNRPFDYKSAIVAYPPDEKPSFEPIKWSDKRSLEESPALIG